MNIIKDSVESYDEALLDITDRLNRCIRLGFDNDNAIANLNTFIKEDILEVDRALRDGVAAIPYEEKGPLRKRLDEIETKRKSTLILWNKQRDQARFNNGNKRFL